VLKRENDQLKVHKALLEKEKEDLKSEISKTNQQREHYYEILVKIKNSFYQTEVMNQLQL
jgi:flagellar biosynthesis chaperone FliJ